MERLDILAEHDLATFLFAECGPYGLDELPTDVARLIDQLQANPLKP